MNYLNWTFRNLANLVTGIRLAMCIVIAFLGFFCSSRMDIIFWWALVAILTDPIDGIIARKLGIISSFGAKFDRFTDKMLEFVMFAIILASPHVVFWLKLAVWPMVIVEALLLGTIYFGVRHREMDVSAGWWGKAKMILVSVAIMVSTLMIAVIQRSICVPDFLQTVIAITFLISFALGIMSLRGHMHQWLDQAF